MDVPETKYAKTADGVHIAYQVCGSGPLDLVLVNSCVGPATADEPSRSRRP